MKKVKNNKVRNNKGTPIPVRWLGVEYNSLKECAQATGRSIAYIKKWKDDPEHYWKGVDFSKEHTMPEIAEHLWKSGMTPNKLRKQNIYQILKRAIDKIFEGHTDIQEWMERQLKK
jgi:hypothetical protein